MPGSTRRRRQPPSRARSGSSRSVPAIAVGVVVTAVVVDFFASRPALLVAILVTLGVGTVAAGGVYLHLATTRRRREAELTRSIRGVDAMTGPQFEQFVAALMRRTGFAHVQVSGGAGDLGADITALVPDGHLVVQCKRYRTGRPVGSADVQKLAGTARELHRAELAAIVTSSHFTRPAVEIAARLRIALVDREALAAWATDDLRPPALYRPATPPTRWVAPPG
jgi:restriction system protein